MKRGGAIKPNGRGDNDAVVASGAIPNEGKSFCFFFFRKEALAFLLTALHRRAVRLRQGDLLLPQIALDQGFPGPGFQPLVLALRETASWSSPRSSLSPAATAWWSESLIRLDIMPPPVRVCVLVLPPLQTGPSVIQHNLPLATLWTFDSVARHQSLAKAAAELHLTDSAVSHQMRRLEEAVGQELLVKAGRGIALTDAGRLFARAVAASLQAITDAALNLADAGQAGGRLDIACPPMFANTWLAKNLNEFCVDHPAVECHIRLVENRRVTEITDIDVGIVFGAGGWPDRWSALLAQVDITPVCSPVLLERLGGTMTSPADLRHARLLHWDDGSEWRRWLIEVGVSEVEHKARHLFCSDLGMAIDLAIHGTGLALVSETLSSADLKQGQLIKPFPQAIDAFGGWYATATGSGVRRPCARLFLRWLLARFGRDGAAAVLLRDVTHAGNS